ncbi:MAG: ABC transporter substrate-binding protein [Gammaproteobacteria bacterium]|nr:MAG: ABC transporter substrate-binding protein [Gammaproteobacteria bacterium]
MKRRKFVAALGVGAGALAVSACNSKTDSCGPDGASGTGAQNGVMADKKQTYNWKLVTSWPKNLPGLGEAPERLSRIVKEMSDGRLNIKVYGAGEIVPALEVFDAVSSGVSEIGHSGAYYWKGKAPAAQFFTAIPFGLTAQEINGWLHYGGGLELWRELYDDFGLIPMAGGNTGVQMAGWFNKEINSLEDMKGLKMRIPGLGGEVLRKIGGVPVTLPGGELFTALQTGTIDATEWVGPYNDLAFGLYKAAKYYYYPGWHEPGAMLEFIFNKEKFNALPADLQAILTHGCRAVNQDMLDVYTAKNNDALVTLVEEHNVQLRKFPDEVLKELRKVSHEVALGISETSPLTKRIYDSVMKFKGSVVNYHAISEQAYLNARTL